MGENGFPKTKGKFSFEKSMYEMESLYQEIVLKHKHKQSDEMIKCEYVFKKIHFFVKHSNAVCISYRAKFNFIHLIEHPKAVEGVDGGERLND